MSHGSPPRAARRRRRGALIGPRAGGRHAGQRVLGTLPHWQAKLASYPPNVGPGVGAHSDSGWLTLLWADEPGLEAQLRDGRVGRRASSRRRRRREPRRDAAARVGRLLSRDAAPRRLFIETALSPALLLEPVAERRCGCCLRPVATTLDATGRPPRRATRYCGPTAPTRSSRSRGATPLVFERHHPDLCVLEDGTSRPATRATPRPRDPTARFIVSFRRSRVPRHATRVMY